MRKTISCITPADETIRINVTSLSRSSSCITAPQADPIDVPHYNLGMPLRTAFAVQMVRCGSWMRSLVSYKSRSGILYILVQFICIVERVVMESSSPILMDLVAPIELALEIALDQTAAILNPAADGAGETIHDVLAHPDDSAGSRRRASTS